MALVLGAYIVGAAQAVLLGRGGCLWSWHMPLCVRPPIGVPNPYRVTSALSHRLLSLLVLWVSGGYCVGCMWQMMVGWSVACLGVVGCVLLPKWVGWINVCAQVCREVR